MHSLSKIKCTCHLHRAVYCIVLPPCHRKYKSNATQEVKSTSELVMVSRKISQKTLFILPLMCFCNILLPNSETLAPPHIVIIVLQCVGGAVVGV
uniref:Uncharacterized protein n=1 Tax=Pyxicephalus adspersus TaxID=30357 RepID=A0AAV2ZWV2_PYXAD|nr:TPA: hypothetical protein GDO54_003824 [Pyxicephalus adspersus]